MNQLKIKTAIQVAKSSREVYEAIVDPRHMSNYFISKSSGKMEAGQQVVWKFPEFEETVPVDVIITTPSELIAFEWEGAKATKLRVEITLTQVDEKATVIRITEGEMENDEAGITWLAGNTEGWANFLACLKAYLEHDINLRKGAFYYMKK